MGWWKLERLIAFKVPMDVEMILSDRDFGGLEFTDRVVAWDTVNLFKCTCVLGVIANCISCPFDLFDELLKATIYNLIVKIWVKELNDLFSLLVNSIEACDFQVMADTISLLCEILPVLLKEGP